ncbi:SpvB/TcaC N-terminal domain-containing protein [Flavobacterium columnare]|uniref:SpvB/TcaC N-terminal domain-containing protein n=1 Tax=Flavobacterium columnare TaxID=996 RepID=UPI003C2EFABC
MSKKIYLFFLLIAGIVFAANYNYIKKTIINKPAKVNLIANKKTFSNTIPSKILIHKSDIKEGIIGLNTSQIIDDAFDNLFHIQIPQLPTNDQTVFLEYDLYGYKNGTSIIKSINNTQSTGGNFIAKNNQWLHQKEQISNNIIKKGNNVLFFNAPEIKNNQYKIKNVTLNFYKKENTLQKFELFRFGNKLYIAGFQPEKNTTLYINDKKINTINQHFETEIDYTNQKEITCVKKENNTNTIIPISINNFIPVDYYIPLYNKNIKKEHIIGINGGSINNSNASFQLEKDIIKKNTLFSIEALHTKDIAPLNPSMVNVTQNSFAYRLLPHGIQFKKPGKLTIPYDKKLIPEGYTEKDINLFFFDEKKRLWKEIPKDTLLTHESKITGKTTHFTDFIAGIIKLPESPETSGYTPTSIKDLKAASPAVGITPITPPTANPNGSTSTNFPIEIPKGRTGMQPSLALQYSSEAGHSWTGLGWAINLPSVDIETRWGAPRYDASKETESYTLAGEALLPNAHREAWTDRQTNKQFYPRKEGAFQKITRKGNNPTNYYWIVTDKSGTTTYYGGTPAGIDNTAILQDTNGNIGHWAITLQIDLKGNTIAYQYEKSEGELYIKNIYYTGKNDQKGAYNIHFIKDTDLGEPTREDVQIAARLGFQQTSNKLLRKIEVKFKDQMIRSYGLTYKQGAFKKTLLKEIEVYDTKGNLFYKNSLDYYDDVRDASGNYTPFGEEQTWSVPNDGITPAFPAFKEFKGTHTLTGSSRSISGGFNYRLGIGIPGVGTLNQNTLGGQGGNNWSNTSTYVALEDLDGDNLPDKIFTKGDKVYFRKNLGATGINQFSDTYHVINIGNVGFSRNYSYNYGVDLILGFGQLGANLGYDRQISKNTTTSYFMDFNGDGLTDFADGGTVYYNRLVNGIPTFTPNSTGTPSPIVNEGELLLTGNTQNSEAEIIKKNPLHDIVRLWQAPATGFIQISHIYKLLEDTSTDRQNYKNNDGTDKADGVTLYFQQNNNLIWSETIGATDYLSKQKQDNLFVTKGEHLYFRVSSIKDGNFDNILWEPTINYQDIDPSHTDPNGFSLKTYNPKKDFLVSSQTLIMVPKDSPIRFDGIFSKKTTSDHILLKIISNRFSVGETVVFSKQFLASENITFNFNTIPLINALKGDGFRVIIESETNIDWKNLICNPSIIYKDHSDNQETKPLEVTHTIYNRVDDKYILNHIIPSSKGKATFHNYSGVIQFNKVRPNQSFDSDILITAKQEEKLVARIRYKLTDGYLAYTPKAIDLSYPYDSIVANKPIKIEYYFNNKNTSTLFQQNHSSAFLVIKDSVIIKNKKTLVEYNYFSSENSYYGNFDDVEKKLKIRNRNWGVFLINGNLAANTIDKNLIVSDKKPYDVDPKNMPDISGNTSVTPATHGQFEASKEYFIQAQGNYASNKWLGAEDAIFIKEEYISSARLGEDDLQKFLDTSLPTVQGGGSRALFTISESTSNAYAAGLSASSSGAGANYSEGKSIVIETMTDFNGDRYPDFVRNGNVQFTTPRGGLSNLQNNIGNFSVSIIGSKGGSVNGKYSHGSANSSDTKTNAKTTVQKSSNDKKSNSDAQKAGKYTSISGNIGTGNDYSQKIHTDINGDGLTDQINDNGIVLLNTGYRFLPDYNWKNLNKGINEGNSSDFGAGLGFSFASGSISGGFSYNGSSNEQSKSFLDINADGLPDKIIYTQNNILIFLNLGNGFDTNPLQYPKYASMSKNKSTSYGMNASYAFDFSLTPIPIRIAIQAGASTGNSVSKIESTFNDINGDGNLDYIKSENEDNLTVRLSNIKRTNKLKSVTNAMGNSFTVDYEFKPSSYEANGAKWVLKEVNLFDGHTGDGVDNLISRFTYENPYYDRRERDFYGYAKITTQQINATNNTVYNTQIQEFYNTDFYRKNLLKSTLLLDKDNKKLQETSTTYSITNAQNQTPITEGLLSNPAADLLSVFIAPIHTQEKHYEAGTAFLDKNTYNKYDPQGNIVEYTDLGNGTPQDKVTAKISYHNSLSPYYDGIPKQIEVFTIDGLKRKRATQINPATAEVTQFKMYASNDKVAITDIVYDTYGNIIKITGAPNYKNQRAQITYTYDDQVYSHITQIQDHFGYANKTEYDYRFNTPIKTTDRNEQSTLYTLDDKGRTSTIQGPYEIASGKPYTIAYEYYPTAEVPYAKTRNYDPELNKDIETYTYIDGLGRTLQVKKTASLFGGIDAPDQEGHIISGKVVYDAFGRAVESFYPTFTTTLNNSFSTLASTVNPTKTQYDALGRATKTTLPDGSTTTTTFAIENFKGINALQTTQTDPHGKVAKTYTDATGKNIATIQYDGGNELLTQFSYNALGETAAVINTMGQTTLSTYDWLGRRTQYIHPDAGTTTITYDLAGNMTKRVTSQIEQTMPDGGILYEYDYNRLEHIKYPRYPQNNISYYYGSATENAPRRGRMWLVTDASGGTEYFYGKLGEVEKEIKTLRITPTDNQTYITQYEYDTWNRLQKMIYPDGEVLTYTYNRAGNLQTMQGTKENQTYLYIKQLAYDEFEQRKYLKYGNDTQTHYTYDPTLRRLQQLNVNSGNRAIINNTYTYDLVGNVLGIKNTVPVVANSLGGSSQQTYQYDDLYRLKNATGSYNGQNNHATYTLAMRYNNMHNIVSKELQHEINGTQKGYKLNYQYNNTQHPNAPSVITEDGKPEPRNYEYDGNGNPTQYLEFNNFRKMTWDEENHLMGINDNGRMHLYTYDHTGERVLKSSGDTQNVSINGAQAASINHFDNYTGYVSPYFVISKGKFTKHYFEGAGRITSKIGQGTFAQPTKITAGGINYAQLSTEQQQWLDDYVRNLGLPPGPPTQQGLYASPAATGKPYPSPPKQNANQNQETPEGWPRQPVFNPPGNVPGPPIQFGDPIKPADVTAGDGFVGNGLFEKDIFYYHSDHLGSTSYISSMNGQLSQHVEYIPFGEVLFEEHSSSISMPYLFNGKELDRETNLTYYGARYLDMKTSLWLNVDPLAEEFPDWSPYNFVMNNPIRLVDEDGMAPTDIIIKGKNNSSVTLKTDLIDISVNASSLGVDFGGNYTLQGEDVLSAGLDIVGILDPTGVADGLNAGLQAKNGDWLGAGISALGVVPYLGDVAKVGKIGKDVKIIDKAIDAVKTVNGNSKASEKAQHVYEIVNKTTNKVEKVGISGGKVSKAGDSYRATSQVNKLNKAGGNYTSRIVENIPAGKGARQKALEAEKRVTNANKSTINPRLHKSPKPE